MASLILFDGVCNLCNAWAEFVVRHDSAGVFHFAAQQSRVGQAIIEKHRSRTGELSSVILIEDNAIYTESAAVLRIFARLGAPWSGVFLFRVIPGRARDACYRFVVRHRYRWFGRTEACQEPSAQLKSRFID